MSKSEIEDIKSEIDKQYRWLMQTKHTLYDIDIAFEAIKRFLDNYAYGKEVIDEWQRNLR